MRLEIGQTLEIDIDPVQRYYPADIDVAVGEVYDFAAQGNWQDASQVCGPTGWRNGWSPYVLRFSRLPGYDLFYLGGNIGRDESSNFPIGQSAKVKMKAAGPLFLFANDLWYFYCNNHRVESTPMLVKILRVR